MPRRLLLIDNDARSLEGLRAMLPESEYAIVEARDGEEGLNAFSASRFDAVLLSGMLPRLPSAEVIREIRHRGGATAPPILLMLSGYNGTDTKADAERVGAFEILVRPFSDEDLRSVVSAAIESTDASVRTQRISAAELRKPSSLTTVDIFAEVLEEVEHESAPPSAAAPRSEPDAGEQVEKRLRDTLSGLRDRPPVGAATPPAARPAARPAPSRSTGSTDAEVDELLSRTLSGLKLKARPIVAAAPAAPAAAVPPSAASPAPEPGPAPGPDHFGRYEILERIASGGMAEIFKARRSGVEGFAKIVAIKKILPHIADDEEFITMFADEAKLAARLNHPNIVHIFDLGKIEAGGYFIAMEYVEGRDLRAILQAGREAGALLPAPLAVFIATQVASALDYAHRRMDEDARALHIVHRDVSPPNILVSNEGDVKLCDFGIAKAATVSRTEAGALKGKVPYMSPEQAWGEPLDGRSDVFSLGCVLFEMLTGQKLFRGYSDLNVLEKVRAAEVPAPTSVNQRLPANLDPIVLKALAREPEDRYADASEMLRDLEAVLHSLSPVPGSADLAAYLRHLKVEETAARDRRPQEPLPAAAAVEKPEPEEFSEPASAAVVASLSEGRSEAERKSRAPLYGMIAVAGVLLVAAALLVSRKSAAPAPAAPAAPAAAPAVAATPDTAPLSVSTSVPTAAAPDPKAIEAEVQRQLAAKKELQARKSPGSTPVPAGANARVAQEPAERKPKAAPLGAEPTAPAASAEPTPARAEPTAVPPPTNAPLPTQPLRAPADEAAQVSRGDLVGPGAGVVEPALVSLPRVIYPLLARQRQVSGRVVVMALVNEEGGVSEARIQRGVAAWSGVNEAVLDAVRRANFRPATKNGVAVKMWHTIILDVRP